MQYLHQTIDPLAVKSPPPILFLGTGAGQRKIHLFLGATWLPYQEEIVAAEVAKTDGRSA